MKVFLINLTRNEERLSSFRKHAERHGLVFERVDAVDGKLLDLNFIEEVRNERRTRLPSDTYFLSAGDIGCQQSHLKIYKKIVQDKIPLSLILEDDISFDDDLVFFVNQIKNGEITLPTPLDLLFLGYWAAEIGSTETRCRSKAKLGFFSRRNFAGKFTIGKPIHSLWTTLGYIVSLEGARKLFEIGTPPHLVADELTALSPKKGLEVYAIETPLVYPPEIDFPSETQSNHMPVEIIQTKNILKLINRAIRNSTLFKSLKDTWRQLTM